MADHIHDELAIESELVEGRGGIFDVHLDGRLIYSKFETYRFPEDEEIVGKIRNRREELAIGGGGNP